MQTWSIAQVADFLAKGYWGGESHSFRVTQGGSISVNITALTTAGQALARQALNLWADAIGIRFVEVSTGGQITFDDNEPGAFSEATFSGTSTLSAHVNVSTQWLASYGSTIGGYGFQTYVHEIGHALGLGHAGHYNGSGEYATDALFANDGWPTTIMSYFDQRESSYFADQGFSRVYLGTPMIGDIAAIQLLYGASTTTRTDNTTYGFNSTAGRDPYNASLHSNIAYTVVDSGGVDTLDYSGFSANQTVNLTAGSFSNVGGLTGNVSIALGTTIENAVGGRGYDVLRGNAANNVLTGGAGNDQLYGDGGSDVLVGGTGSDSLTGGVGGDAFQGSASTLSGDTIRDFAADDRIIITDATLASFKFSLSGSTLTYSGGSLTLMGVTGTLVAEAAATGGVQLRLSTASSPSPTATAGNDTLRGGTGADTLDGLAGADTMYGDLGNDTYVVENMGDRAIEDSATGGTDAVRSAISFTLGANVENLTLTGSAALNGTGNGLGNTLVGNGGANVLSGGAGNDVLDGKGSSDTLIGGTGNDTYYISDAGDAISENVGEGTDRALSSVSHTLGANVENLTLTGIAAVNGTGNGLNNAIVGNAGANVLRGGAGNDKLNGKAGSDTLIGGTGNDTYYIDDLVDVITENAGEGTDRALSSVSHTLGANVENLTLTGTSASNGTGNALNNMITGNAGANTLLGAGGADIISGGGGSDNLYGGAGNDRIVGGTGADNFYFDTALSASGNVDKVIDFSVFDDTIRLDDDIFAAAGPLGSLAASAFHVGTAASDASDRIVYDKASGNIYYDADGSGAGAAVLFAQVTAGTALTNLDFMVVG